MQVEINMRYRRCHRCNRWQGSERDDAPCGACAQYDLNEKERRIDELRRSNAALRGALTRKRGRR